MFTNIDAINWAQLSHAYGTAEEVPQQLIALAGADEEQQEQALEYFWENMYHQGSRFEASVHAIPFLFEVLAVSEPRLQKKLIDLLLALAVGLDESFLPRGYDLQEEETRFLNNSWDGLFTTEENRSAYFQVHQRAHNLAEFTQPVFTPETRLSATYAVAHFAQSLSAFHSTVAEYITMEGDESQLQNLILCFGMLGRYADPKPSTDILLDYLTPECFPSLQVASAIALTTIWGPETPELALQTLLKALSEGWKLASPDDQDGRWNDGDLLGYAALSLRFVGKNRREEIAPALGAALMKSEFCTFAIPKMLLEILFPDPSPADGRRVADFDSVQRTSLRCLLLSNHWKDWMISSKILPVDLVGDDHALERVFHDITGVKYQPDPSKHSGNVSSWHYKKYWP